MSNPFVGFDTFTKQLTDDEEHPHGEDSHLDDDSILERYGDVETDDNYYEPDDDVDLQWGKVSDAAKGAVGAAKSGATKAAKTAQTAGTAVGAKVSDAAQTAKGFGQAAAATGMDAAQTAGKAAGQKVAGAFGKSHDEMMDSLDEAIGLIEKQTIRNIERGIAEQEEYTEPRGGWDAGGQDDDLDDPNLNAYQRAALQESREEEPEVEEYEAASEDDDMAYLYQSEEKSFAKTLGSVIKQLEK